MVGSTYLEQVVGVPHVHKVGRRGAGPLFFMPKLRLNQTFPWSSASSTASRSSSLASTPTTVASPCARSSALAS